MSQAMFVQEGGAVDYTPAADVAVGEVVVQGELVGVAKQAIAADALGSIAVVGVFDFAKATGASTAIAAGVLVYWDDTNDVATTDDDSGANKLIGKTITAAGDDDATVRVRMTQ